MREIKMQLIDSIETYDRDNVPCEGTCGKRYSKENMVTIESLHVCGRNPHQTRYFCELCYFNVYLGGMK